VSTTISLIKNALIASFQPLSLDVIDDKNEHIGHANQDSGHFTVIIESPVFAGKNAIAAHRMVYAALGALMQTHIHALRIQIK
jgi:BolA family transcriptional regulator, general stress-responsive regulator